VPKLEREIDDTRPGGHATECTTSTAKANERTGRDRNLTHAMSSSGCIIAADREAGSIENDFAPYMYNVSASPGGGPCGGQWEDNTAAEAGILGDGTIQDHGSMDRVVG
jgi:hypothetical protein